MKNLFYKQPIRDYIRFRLVLLNDDDTVKEVLFTSKEYAPTSGFGDEFGEEHYKVMMQFNEVYHFVDYDNVPPMEFQAQRKSTGDKWWFLSDPIDDYYNT